MSLKISVQTSDDMPVGASRITEKTATTQENDQTDISY